MINNNFLTSETVGEFLDDTIRVKTECCSCDDYKINKIWCVNIETQLGFYGRIENFIKFCNNNPEWRDAIIVGRGYKPREEFAELEVIFDVN